MSPPPNEPAPIYDRAYLLGEDKRNEVLALWEVVRYGSDSFGDRDYLTLYELKPADWYARGVRLLARTAVECTRDALASLIGRDVAAAARSAPGVTRSVVVDPFAGSANTLYWLAHHTQARQAVGFELDERVYAATRRNLEILGFNIELRHAGHQAGMAALRVAENELLIVFLAPPWGDALREGSGLDLRHTRPPVPAIIDLVARSFSPQKTVLAVQVHETVLPASIKEVSSRCQSSELMTYDINDPGENHGVLLGALGWSI